MLRYCVVVRSSAGDLWAEYVTAYNRAQAADLVESSFLFRSAEGEIVYLGVVPDSDTLPRT